jgi:hypothetical protein
MDRRPPNAPALMLALALGLSLATSACGDNGGVPCTDPCDQLGAIRCYGPVIQRCLTAPDGCRVWEDELDCADQGLLCMSPATGPECGMVCTDPCSTNMSRCSSDVWQTCEADAWGCMDWEDFQDCTVTSLVCDDTSGDASCLAP